jgi:hypothetical protein
MIGFLFKLIIYFTELIFVPQDSERADIASVRFRRLRKSEKLGDGLHIRTSGIQNFEFSPVRSDTFHSISHWEVWPRQLRHSGPCLVLIHRQI